MEWILEEGVDVPFEEEMDEPEMVQVYCAQGPMEAAVIQSVLESNGIPCMLRSCVAHSVHAFTVDGLGEVKVFVPTALAEEALKIIYQKDEKV
jgi:hypothetical protein